MEKEVLIRRTGMIVTFIGIIWLSIVIFTGVMGWYEYKKLYSSYWSLAEKQSSIEEKSFYIDKFFRALQVSSMHGQYNAVFLKTPNNSFDMNLEALKSLQVRLNEIKKMDVSSFQYQTAIQQITAQEQGEAKNMLNVFSGVWWKTNHIMLWNWICIIHCLIICSIIFFGIRYWNYGGWD